MPSSFHSPMVDILTRYYNSKLGDDVGLDGNDDDNIISYTSTWKMTTNRAIILSGVVANFFAICVAFSVREIKVDTHLNSIPVPTEENGQHDTSDVNNQTSSPGPKVAEFKPLKGSTWQILSDTFRTPNFRRYLFVCLLLLNVRMIFRHLDGTLPKYMMREFGADAPKGLVYSINPFMIIILVPIITAATTTVEPLVMIKYGTYVSALSVFFLAFSTSLWACVMFVVCLSLGEALWSPRLYDYTMSVCQEGREGTCEYYLVNFVTCIPKGSHSHLSLGRHGIELCSSLPSQVTSRILEWVAPAEILSSLCRRRRCETQQNNVVHYWFNIDCKSNMYHCVLGLHFRR